jgi:hypothetical protein
MLLTIRPLKYFVAVKRLARAFQQCSEVGRKISVLCIQALLQSRIQMMNYPKRPSFIEGQNEMATKSTLKHFGKNEFSEQFDYVMVFKMVETDTQPEQSAAAKTCISAMLTAGLEVFPYLSVQKDELFVLIRAPVSYGCCPCRKHLCVIYTRFHPRSWRSSRSSPTMRTTSLGWTRSFLRTL